MWCGVVRCGVVWCGVAWCGVLWCGVVWCGLVYCGMAWNGMGRGYVACEHGTAKNTVGAATGSYAAFMARNN